MASPTPRTSPVWLPDDCDLVLNADGGVGIVLRLLWWGKEAPYEPLVTIHGASAPAVGETVLVNRDGEGWLELEVMARRWVYSTDGQFVQLLVDTVERAQARRDAGRRLWQGSRQRGRRS